jgi:hypothetical protein
MPLPVTRLDVLLGKDILQCDETVQDLILEYLELNIDCCSNLPVMSDSENVWY